MNRSNYLFLNFLCQITTAAAMADAANNPTYKIMFVSSPVLGFSTTAPASLLEVTGFTELLFLFASSNLTGVFFSSLSVVESTGFSSFSVPSVGSVETLSSSGSVAGSLEGSLSSPVSAGGATGELFSSSSWTLLSTTCNAFAS